MMNDELKTLEDEVNRLRYVEHGLRREIAKLREALGVYADGAHWDFLDGWEVERRMWRGPGGGPVLAKLALVKGVPEGSEEPNVSEVSDG